MSYLPPHPRGPAPALFKAAAETLLSMAALVEDLGADLCADPAIVERHLTSLQAIDRLAQHLDQIAAVIGADDPVRAVETVKLSELKTHLANAA